MNREAVVRALALAALSPATVEPPVLIPTRKDARNKAFRPEVDWSQKRLGPIRNTRRRVGRNEKCPFCASGKKFKKCHKRGTQQRRDPAFAGHPQEHPALYVCTYVAPKGPRPAERAVIE